MFSKKLACSAFGAVLACTGGAAFADTIDPSSFEATLADGESVTIQKTVVIDDSPPTDALLDVMFLFDTSGSMGAAIDGAKAAAGDILTGLSGFGDLAGGAGAYSENAGLIGDPCVFIGGSGSGCDVAGDTIQAPGAAINVDLTTNSTDIGNAINAITLNDPDWGDDYPERGNDAIKLVADNTTWRDGSNRFIIVLGDAAFKNDLVTDAAAAQSLLDNDVTLIGLRFSNLSRSDPDSDDLTFAESVTDLGGISYATGTDPGDIVAAILAAISASFETYTTVSVDDFGAGLPEITVSVVCTSADAGLDGTGACVGADAVGSYDRSAERTFTFDVTFTRTGPGDASFVTCATVDGACVAREFDRFRDGPSEVPLPAGVWLLIGGLGGLAAMKRRAA